MSLPNGDNNAWGSIRDTKKIVTNNIRDTNAEESRNSKFYENIDTFLLQTLLRESFLVFGSSSLFIKPNLA